MSDDNPQSEVIKGFSQKVLRYFLTFLQTDFKKQQIPRRKIQLKSDVGFRMGVPLRKYVSLYKAVWKFISEAPEKGLTFKISPGRYTAPISPTLRDLIRQHVDAIREDVISRIPKTTIEYAIARRGKAVEHPEKFVDSIQVHFVEEIGTRIVQPLLALLEGPFRDSSYSAIESIYDIEADLTDVVVSRTLENLPTAINTLIVSGNTAPFQEVFDEFFMPKDIRARIQSFFDDFAISDSFQELRDLQHSLRSAENQSLYLYLCEVRFGPHVFPLFYIPATMEYVADDRAFILQFDPHLLINKQAVDWILQERKGEATKLPISPVADRILYLDGKRSFREEMETVFTKLVPAFELAANIDLKKDTLQQASSPTLKLSTSAYFAIFDKSDESLVNDYEELLAAFSEEQKGASRLFENIVQGFISDNPVSVSSSIDSMWDGMEIPDRLVANTPIPVNEEQRKILAALKNPDCNYISVQGPPGTGKSHTITALAFEGILNEQTVLILSDKTEALDVVQDKLESVLSKVRHGDDDFPNPILRLGRTNTFNRLVSASAREKIKTHHQAALRHADLLNRESTETMATLRSDIGKTISTLSAIRFDELNELHRLEMEIDSIRPGLVARLQMPRLKDQVSSISTSVEKIDSAIFSAILFKISKEPGSETLEGILLLLATWKIAGELATQMIPVSPLGIFTFLEAAHHPILLQFIGEYDALHMPVFGFLFNRRKVQALNLKLGKMLPCPDPIDLHKRLNDLKQVTRVLGLIKDGLGRNHLEPLCGFVYRLIKEGEATKPGVSELESLMRSFTTIILGDPSEADLVLKSKDFHSLDVLLELVLKASRYAILWREIAIRMEALPKTDYISTKTRLEQLNTARMTVEIDRRFIDFVENKKATVKEFSGVIKGKQKFPEDEFHYLSDAFPVIIAGIREYAEYVPLKLRLFDLVVIDEASQVSVAQALPAVLRAKKVVVFGDAKQFSNVKSSQASNSINAGHLTDIEAYFRAKVSDATTKLERLKYFDVKRSILEFFDLISNYQTMLRKHFRGYQELISFSSKHFYDGQLQAIKIRSRPIQEIIRFEVLESVPDSAVKNTNRTEAEFILRELHRMLDEGEDMTVGIITPFREQVKVLNEVLYRDSYGERFDTEMRLKIMTFDTCQGEERDLVIYSMVATSSRDVLNYVFPIDLKGIADKAEDALKVQRLNVGFSRAKEAFLFVLSKPVDQFKGSIGSVLLHYKSILENRSRPDESKVDPSSPMERKVLDWISKTAFYQRNEEYIEVVPQFPIGEYLKQLDPFYSHPAYRCDFLVRYYKEQGSINIIIEYDGFAEHFVERQKIHSGNWDRYYRPEDIERQMVIESYGYKFLRLNRFNLGEDPVASLSKRLYELVDGASRADKEDTLVTRIKEDAESLSDGSKKRCPKCGEIREIQDFWDLKLKRGNGGYGRNCMQCKQNPIKVSSGKRHSGWRSRHGWWY